MPKYKLVKQPARKRRQSQTHVANDSTVRHHVSSPYKHVVASVHAHHDDGCSRMVVVPRPVVVGKQRVPDLSVDDQFRVHFIVILGVYGERKHVESRHWDVKDAVVMVEAVPEVCYLQRTSTCTLYTCSLMSE